MRIHLLSPNPGDATSFYRCYGPFAALRRKHWYVDLVDSTSVNQSSISLSDIVFLQRPYSDEHVQVAKMCKATNTKLVIDYDDLLWKIPPENKAHHNYESEATKSNLNKLLQYASEVWCATDHLATYLKPLTQQVRVIPNAIPKHLMTPLTDDKRKVVLWRGSDTHSHDLYAVKDVLIKLMEEFQDFLFLFMGYYPHYLAHVPNFRHVKGTSVSEYLESIKELSPAVMYHPLNDNPFNHSKSMCSWLEATSINSLFVAPNTKEFERDGIYTYDVSKPYTLHSAMRCAIVDAQNGEFGNMQLSKKAILSSLTLDHTNELRIEYLRQLLT